jgi:branched-chain amino acid transport system ATP-binding protein
MTKALLTLSGVHTHIGGYHILHGVDLQVPEAGVTLLLGRNGAGKTTTLRTIMGLWRASRGQVMFDGQDLTAAPTAMIARAGIAYVPENMGIFGDLTVRENLLLAARSARTIRDIDPARLQRIMEAFPALARFYEQPAGWLSGGQKQMLALARAMVEPCRLLLIDEPSKGLAPAIVKNVIATLAELRSMGTTILLVEQNVQFARELADTVAVMDDGVIVHRAAMHDFAADAATQQRLLGLSLQETP